MPPKAAAIQQEGEWTYIRFISEGTMPGEGSYKSMFTYNIKGSAVPGKIQTNDGKREISLLGMPAKRSRNNSINTKTDLPYRPDASERMYQKQIFL